LEDRNRRRPIVGPLAGFPHHAEAPDTTPIKKS